MPPASPVPPLPADCRVETLAEWLRLNVEETDMSRADARLLARAVRALLEDRARLAVRFCSYDDETDAHVADVVRHVLGAP